MCWYGKLRIYFDGETRDAAASLARQSETRVANTLVLT